MKIQLCNVRIVRMVTFLRLGTNNPRKRILIQKSKLITELKLK
jgi:hypothetical protein